MVKQYWGYFDKWVDLPDYIFMSNSSYINDNTNITKLNKAYLQFKYAKEQKLKYINFYQIQYSPFANLHIFKLIR